MQPDGMTLAEWLSAAVLAERDRAEFLRALAAAMPQGQALVDLADWIDRDLAAKRAIQGLHQETVVPGYGRAGMCRECENMTYPCPTVRHLATVYADREGYNPDLRLQ